jgi:LuxR family maltose regulon positive regulatory protein
VSAKAQPGAPLAELLLKATPPRAPRNLLLRPRLGSGEPHFADRPLVLVQAPAGFGKTSLLAQWRREHLGRGTTVAWLSADSADDARRFVQGLALAVRQACGRPEFGRAILEGAAPADELDAVTAWLAELAQAAIDLVVMIDDADRLVPAVLHGCLSYLVHNPPSNLRVVVAARGDIDLDVADLVAYGSCVAISADMLRFTLAETIAAARQALGTRVDTDDSARLHEATEGWPLGLQLALASVEANTDARAAIQALSKPSGHTPARLLAGLLANLAPEDSDFLARASGLSLLHPDLCRAITGDENAAERLARLVRDTPILVATEDGEWLRMHTLARDALRTRFASLPAGERESLQAAAAAWLANRGFIEEAAHHAYEAGRRDLAFDFAEQCLYGAMIHGRHSSVLEWLERLPEGELDRRPRLRLAAAWALALTQRNEQAGRQVARILGQQGVDEALRYECALILSGAAYFADEPDRYNELFAPWADYRPVDASLARMHTNRLSVRALVAGEPAEARRYQVGAPREDAGAAFPFLARWGDFFVALAYLWEGQVRLAEDTLRSVVVEAEVRMGRRAPLTCMLATLLAAAKWERNQPDEAAALLANRLDVLERAGVPETLLLAYRTLARIAAAAGDEHRALDMLESLRSAAAERKLPRLEIASLADQVRAHARRFRPETCRALCRQIDEVLAREGLPKGPLWERSAQVLRALAQGYFAIACQDWRAAIAALQTAEDLALAARQGRVRLEAMALRAFALDRNGGDGSALVREAWNLAQTYGLARLFDDAHPALGDWARRVLDPEGEGVPAPVAPRRAPHSALRAPPSTVLTPKEREVLELLARNLSNKEIASAMGVGEETVKWHLKNLFGKLSAGSRKHVVRRAQLLGLLEAVG